MNTAKLIVESSPGAIVVVSRDGKIKLVNSRAEEMFGYDHPELLGQQIEILLPKRTQNQHTQYRRTLTENPTQRKMGTGRDRIARRKDGSEFPVEVGFSPIRTEDGLMILASIVDITIRKEAEEALQVNFEQFSRKNRYQEIISVITKSIHESRDLQTVLDNAIETIRKNIDKLDIASTYLIEGDDIVVKAQRGFSADYISRAGRSPYPKDVTWKTAIEGKSKYIRRQVQEEWENAEV